MTTKNEMRKLYETAFDDGRAIERENALKNEDSSIVSIARLLHNIDQSLRVIAESAMEDDPSIGMRTHPSGISEELTKDWKYPDYRD